MDFVDNLPEGHPLREAEKVATDLLKKRDSDCPEHVKSFIAHAPQITHKEN